MAGSENTYKRKRFDLPGDEQNDEAINDTSMIEAARIMSPVTNVSIFTNILPNDIIYLVCLWKRYLTRWSHKNAQFMLTEKFIGQTFRLSG